MLNIKENLQVYNYTVKHVKGTKNHLADVLSRRTVWLNTDHTIGPDKGLNLEDGDAFPMRVMVSMPHLLQDNPLLREHDDGWVHSFIRRNILLMIYLFLL